MDPGHGSQSSWSHLYTEGRWTSILCQGSFCATILYWYGCGHRGRGANNVGYQLCAWHSWILAWSSQTEFCFAMQNPARPGEMSWNHVVQADKITAMCLAFMDSCLELTNGILFRNAK